jgi:hypothetical protein
MHQERIANERYACIYRNLAKFDKLNYLSIIKYSNPLVRAALCRARFKFEKNSKKNSIRLLCLTANLAMKNSLFSSAIFFNGLKQSNKYRENLLNGLWNYQLRNNHSEQLFHQWLTNRICSCAICYLLNSNKKFENDYFLSIRHLLMLKQLKTKSNDLLQCHQCFVTVHQDCYENLCLALNVEINYDDEPWICQRCSLQKSSFEILDDRCTACLFRGGLLLNPHSSSSFIHAVCSIYQAYEQSSSNQMKSCHYCWSFCPLNYRQISTQIFVPCIYPKCSNLFHVTCGLINGCTFEIDHDYSIINARCHLHVIPHQSSMKMMNHHQSSTDNIDYETMECYDNPFDDEQQQQHDDNDDDEIVAENERVPIGTRIILNDVNQKKFGRVIGNEINFHYAVDFGDGCYSHDMLAEDILDFDPSIEPLTLTKGANIRIKWTDGTLYSCKYLGRKRVLLYHINIDNETRQMRRSEFSYDNQPPSPPLTPCQTEREHNYSRRQPLNTGRKRQYSRKQQQQVKSKRRRILSSSSSSDES